MICVEDDPKETIKYKYFYLRMAFLIAGIQIFKLRAPTFVKLHSELADLTQLQLVGVGVDFVFPLSQEEQEEQEQEEQEPSPNFYQKERSNMSNIA